MVVRKKHRNKPLSTCIESKPSDRKSLRTHVVSTHAVRHAEKMELFFLAAQEGARTPNSMHVATIAPAWNTRGVLGLVSEGWPHSMAFRKRLAQTIP